jgi:hypothetical protein
VDLGGDRLRHRHDGAHRLDPQLDHARSLRYVLDHRGSHQAGLNDVTPGFFITAGVLALKYRPWLGAVLIAVAAGFKPYAAAWFPGVIGVGGLAGLGALIVTSLLLWLPPALLWGPASIVRSLELAREVHAVSANALNIPILRLLALPIAIAALFLKQWWMAAVTGLAIFLIVLFFDFWASLGYLVAVAPITGILLEMGSRHLRQRRRSATTSTGVAVA